MTALPGKPALLMLILSLILSACMGSGYSIERQPLASARNTSGPSSLHQPEASPLVSGDEGRIVFSLSDQYEQDPPACAVIRAADPGGAGSVLASTVEQAITVHLGGKLDRVIGPARRDRILRKQNLDLDHAGDARTFAWKTRCRAILSWRLTGASETFLLAWGGRRIGLELSLKRIGKQDMLWRASHATRRSGGGLPLSPVGLVMDTLRAGQFMGDRDMLASMVHDVVRRLFTTLPQGL